jgi:hypothetical protein
MVFLLLLIQKPNAVLVDSLMLKLYVHLVAACMNDDVELYGLKAKSNQFKTLRRRIARQVDDSILSLMMLMKLLMMLKLKKLMLLMMMLMLILLVLKLLLLLKLNYKLYLK